jgi:tetratricopeptide (TPR) repeat protein
MHGTNETKRPRRRVPAWLAAFAALSAVSLAPAASYPRAAGAQDELEGAADLEREEAANWLRRGDWRRAQKRLDELLEAGAADPASRALYAQCRARAGDWTAALEAGARALAEAEGAPAEVRAECARTLAALLIEVGRAREALETLRGEAAVDPGKDARDAWALGSALRAAGQREAAAHAFEQGARHERGESWPRLLARARCERALGSLQRASRTLVQADESAELAGGREPDVLAELASVYFEADAELDHAEAKPRSPGELYRAALAIDETHEAASVGLFELGRANWNRQRDPPHAILERFLAARPRAIAALVAGASSDVDDGKLASARERLARLREIAPGRRDVRSLEAAVAWIENRRGEAEVILSALASEDPRDGAPRRDLGAHLCELYRFAEAVPHLRAAVERDPGDWNAWADLGRALANTGAEEEGLAALEKSEELAAGRQHPWRRNTILVLRKMRRDLTVERGASELSYSWSPEAAEVLRAYWMPFYESARAELAARYGYTPGPVQIEVFGEHSDFSVRSTGFVGFPALGVCFGPVVTAVSPLSELRGKFSWARTSFHEFTHVVHLGLSHNRCPRWVTEGLATWEEEEKNLSWSRNLRRELVDALANRDLIPVRELNRAFRGSRILFGYYQGGLLCRMLIEERGFSPMVRLLEAFDRGADLDGALSAVFGSSPEEVDRRFESYVRAKTASLAIEPRWSRETVVREKFSLASEPPPAPDARRDWGERWCTVARGLWQSGQKVDAEQALRNLDRAGLAPPRASFLRAELALAAGERDRARELFERGIADGGEEFHARMALGRLAMDAEDWPRAEEHFRAAERDFPGFPEPELSAELALAQVYGELDRRDDVQRARERWLAFNSDEVELRLRVARWHDEAGRLSDAARLLDECNQVDPFRRALHEQWADVLARDGRHLEAAREFRVARLVPPELDLDRPEPLTDSERAELLGLEARELAAAGKIEEALGVAKEALELDEDEQNALEVLERSQ